MLKRILLLLTICLLVGGGFLWVHSSERPPASGIDVAKAKPSGKKATAKKKQKNGNAKKKTKKQKHTKQQRARTHETRSPPEEPVQRSLHCGNGIVQSSGVSRTEQCDDGNTANGDGCSADCQRERGWQCSGQPTKCIPICGDGLVRGNEQCDQGNGTAYDGCEDGPPLITIPGSACTISRNWNCHNTSPDSPSVCTPGPGAMRCTYTPSSTVCTPASP